MPDFAVVTNFRVNEGLTRFFAQGATGATRFQAAVEGAFKRSSAAASTFSQVFGGVTLGNLAANGVRRVGSEIKELALGSKDAARDLAALKTAYGSVFGGDATTQMAFATSEADRLGLSVEAQPPNTTCTEQSTKATSPKHTPDSCAKRSSLVTRPRTNRRASSQPSRPLRTSEPSRQDFSAQN